LIIILVRNQGLKKETGLIRQKTYSVLGLFVLVFFFHMTASPLRAWAFEKTSTVPVGEHLSLGIIAEYYFSSHTSYEFGNPFPPYQNPLSRLEFPLDSWWAGAKLRAGFPRFSLGLKALTNLSPEAYGRMRDSDWDDDNNPNRKTIYSESSSRLDPSYFVEIDLDMKVSDWLHWPSRLDLRPVIGFRWQQFNIVTHDGSQLTVGEPPAPLPGDTLRFEQTYRQIFLGLRGDLDLGKWAWLTRLTTLFQVDWAYVEGHNQDHHLLRQGARYTYDDTTGQAWHGAIGLKAGLSRHLALTLKTDFVRIVTTGTHRLVNAPLGIDLKWSNGVNVWSDQNSISLNLDYTF
jgi:outer membrane protease